MDEIDSLNVGRGPKGVSVSEKGEGVLVGKGRTGERV